MGAREKNGNAKKRAKGFDDSLIVRCDKKEKRSYRRGAKLAKLPMSQWVRQTLEKQYREEIQASK